MKYKMRQIETIKRCEKRFYIIWLIITLTPFLALGCKNKTKEYRSDDQVIIKGKYMGWACDDYTPQIAPIEEIDNLIDINSQFYGFTFWVLNGSKSPDMIEAICVPGNIFELKGYYYYTLDENKKKLSYRFDLVDWKVVAPYYRWKENGDKELITNNVKRENIKNQNYFENSDFKKAHKYNIDCQ